MTADTDSESTDAHSRAGLHRTIRRFSESSAWGQTLSSGYYETVFPLAETCPQGDSSGTDEQKFRIRGGSFYRRLFNKMEGSCGLPWWLSMKESAYSIGDPSLIPGSRRSPGGRNGNPLQYSCLEDPTDKEAWWAAGHRVTKSHTRLKQLSSSRSRPRWGQRAREQPS